MDQAWVSRDTCVPAVLFSPRKSGWWFSITQVWIVITECLISSYVMQSNTKYNKNLKFL